jgi:hypothetical protein
MAQIKVEKTIQLHSLNYCLNFGLRFEQELETIWASYQDWVLPKAGG